MLEAGVLETKVMGFQNLASVGTNSRCHLTWIEVCVKSLLGRVNEKKSSVVVEKEK